MRPRSGRLQIHGRLLAGAAARLDLIGDLLALSQATQASTSHWVEHGTIPLTHEFWADRLGTQRSTISAVMKKFDTSGWIKQGRGGITITDPTALREASCECYQTIHDVFVRLLPYTAVAR
jgi:CRP-like cAMP-binding protein